MLHVHNSLSEAAYSVGAEVLLLNTLAGAGPSIFSGVAIAVLWMTICIMLMCHATGWTTHSATRSHGNVWRHRMKCILWPLQSLWIDPSYSSCLCTPP